MNHNEIYYHLYERPKRIQDEAEHERLVQDLIKSLKERKRKAKQPRNSI